MFLIVIIFGNPLRAYVGRTNVVHGKWKHANVITEMSVRKCHARQSRYRH
jgi:hypothetical protein